MGIMGEVKEEGGGREGIGEKDIAQLKTIKKLKEKKLPATIE